MHCQVDFLAIAEEAVVMSRMAVDKVGGRISFCHEHIGFDS